jgi:hypothetical protein
LSCDTENILDAFDRKLLIGVFGANEKATRQLGGLLFKGE